MLMLMLILMLMVKPRLMLMIALALALARMRARARARERAHAHGHAHAHAYAEANPNANAEATIQYLDSTSAGQGVRANFSLYEAGNVAVGLYEAGLARQHTQVNIDRGPNTTTTGASPDQFLQILPSETAEGGLRVDFLGTDATGTAWSNPVYAFGFYLTGREAKRDVYLDVKDIYGNLIHSSVTTEGEIVTPTTAVEYITFQVEANESPIGSFELREEYNGEDAIWRDVFSIDNLSL